MAAFVFPQARKGGAMFTYKFQLADGSDVGEAAYLSRVKVGEGLRAGRRKPRGPAARLLHR